MLFSKEDCQRKTRTQAPMIDHVTISVRMRGRRLGTCAPEVSETDLEMAEWLLSREIEERDHAPAKSFASQSERRAST